MLYRRILRVNHLFTRLRWGLHSNSDALTRAREEPMLVLNCKNYAEATGSRLARLYRAAEASSRRHGARIAIAPPPHLVSAARSRRVATLAQHADDRGPGSTTGHVVPELLRAAGVAGSIINHSEHRLRPAEIRAVIGRLRSLGMSSIACARTAPEAARIAALGPDYVAIEPPSLIGSGTAISRARPGLIRDAARAVSRSRSRLLCGAGIVSGEDVARAGELGAEGILVASGVVKARSPARALDELASRMPRRRAVRGE